MATLGHEEIGGLNVPMNNALRMSRVQRIRDLNAER